MFKATLSIAILLVLASADVLQTDSWDTASSLPYRKLIFEANKKIVADHNGDPNRSYEMRLYPQFAGRTVEENAQLFLNKNPIKSISEIQSLPNSHEVSTKTKIDKVGTVYKVDLSGYTPLVTSQQKCGNCYAIASTDCINTMNRIRGKSVPALSVEELTDCSSGASLAYRNLGCNGGDMQYSMWYVTNYGLHSAADYPTSPLTLAGTAQPCRSLPTRQLYRITGWATVNSDQGSCINRANLLLNGYAVATAMFAGNYAVLYYSSGIIRGCPASSVLVDHAVLIVGFMHDGTSNSYLKIKNSWGEAWGMRGSFLVAFGNVCNTCIYSVVAIV